MLGSLERTWEVRQLLIDVKNCGDGDDHPDRVHVLLIHETSMSVTESGVMVSM